MVWFFLVSLNGRTPYYVGWLAPGSPNLRVQGLPLREHVTLNYGLRTSQGVCYCSIYRLRTSIILRSIMSLRNLLVLPRVLYNYSATQLGLWQEWKVQQNRISLFIVSVNGRTLRIWLACLRRRPVPSRKMHSMVRRVMAKIPLRLIISMLPAEAQMGIEPVASTRELVIWHMILCYTVSIYSYLCYHFNVVCSYMLLLCCFINLFRYKAKLHCVSSSFSGQA